MPEMTYKFSERELAAAAEIVRDKLTDAFHGRGDPQLHLLSGSKSSIERAIIEAIHAGARWCRENEERR